MLCWHKSLLQVHHDKEAGNGCPGGYDHIAGAGGALAVPDCCRLLIDLTNACGSVAPIGFPPGWSKVRGALAWILLYLVVLVSFCFLLFLTGKTAIHEIQQLVTTLSVQNEWKLPLWLEGGSFQQTLLAWLPPPSNLIDAVTGDQGQLVFPALLGFSQGIGSIASGLMVILFLSIYWSINQIHFEQLWLSLLPSGQRKQARGVWRTIEPEIGAYVRREVLISILAGVLLGLGYWLLGSPYPALIALAGALASLIPVVGIPLVVIPVLLVGLLTSVQMGLFTALYALVVLIVLGVWVKPRLANRKWNNPILTVVLVITLASAFGLVGIIVAPLLSIVCQILWRRLVSHRHVLGVAAQVSDLKERQESLRATINAMDGPPLPLVTSSMERLTRLIEKAEPVLQASLPAEPSDLSLNTANLPATAEAGPAISINKG